MDGEVGRFEFPTHSIGCGGQVVFNSARDLFPQLKGREWYKTTGFKEMAFSYGCTESSFRKTSELINRFRYQEGATPSRTLQDAAVLEGENIVEHLETKASQIIGENNFTREGVPANDNIEYVDLASTVLEQKELMGAFEECQRRSQLKEETWDNPLAYEVTENTVYIDIDEVGSKKQKEKRGDGTQRDKKRIYNTVSRVAHKDKSYVFAGKGVWVVLLQVLAFLLGNSLLKYRLQFFTDGQRSLRINILKMFSWHSNLCIILDWYHLEKKCKELLSLALKGRHIRNKVLEELLPLLWHGLTSKAIEYLESLDETQIKHKEALSSLVGYFERNELHIPCYAVRKQLGLRNSSNIGEKMNDLVVSDRQKHNGMSWSQSGSLSLATLSTLIRNQEDKRWFEQGAIEFKLAS